MIHICGPNGSTLLGATSRDPLQRTAGGAAADAALTQTEVAVLLRRAVRMPTLCRPDSQPNGQACQKSRQSLIQSGWSFVFCGPLG